MGVRWQAHCRGVAELYSEHGGTHCIHHGGWDPWHLCLVQCQCSPRPRSWLRISGQGNIRETWHSRLECVNWILIQLLLIFGDFFFTQGFKNLKALQKSIRVATLSSVNCVCPCSTPDVMICNASFSFQYSIYLSSISVHTFCRVTWGQKQSQKPERLED